MHELSGGIEARQVSQCGDHGRRDRALDAPESLERLADRLEAPGVHWRGQCVFQTLEAFGVFGHRLDIFLKDHVLRGGGTDYFTEPTQGGRAPMGSPGRADSVPQQAGFETPRGRLQIPEGVFPRPAEVAHGCIVDGGDRDGGEIA